MNTITLILLILYLAIGFISFTIISVTWTAIVVRNKKVDAYFYFLSYASEKEKTALKIGAIGIVIAVIIFFYFVFFGE
jgi:hypothetical protein